MAQSAIILSAGENRRMGIDVKTKALLPLAKGNFLSRHISLLTQNGISKIYIITTESLAPLFSKYRNDDVKVIVSRFSGKRVGSSLSLLCGLESVLDDELQHGVIIMDADIVYERLLLQKVIAASCGESVLFIINKTSGDSEEVRVYLHKANDSVLIGKGFFPSLTEGFGLLGESLGIIYLAESEIEYCRDLIYWIAGKSWLDKGFGDSGKMTEHEQLWQYLFNLKRLGFFQLPQNYIFAECDTPEDYQRICNSVFPGILKKDDRIRQIEFTAEFDENEK